MHDHTVHGNRIAGDLQLRRLLDVDKTDAAKSGGTELRMIAVHRNSVAACFAASTSRVPLGTVSGDSVDGQRYGLRHFFRRSSRRPELRLETFHHGGEKRLDRIAERTKINPRQLPAYGKQHINIRITTFPREQPFKRTLQPPTAFPTRRTLTAGLMSEKTDERMGGFHEIRRLVHDDHRTGTKHGPAFAIASKS